MMRLVATVPLLKHWEQSAKLRGGVGGSHTDLHTGQGDMAGNYPAYENQRFHQLRKTYFKTKN